MQLDDAARSEPNPRNDCRFILKCFVYAVLITTIAYVIYDLTQEDYSSRYAFGFTAIGIWAFGVTALLIGHLCRPSTRHRTKQTAILLFVYLGTYVYFTSGGEYEFSQSGKPRYSFGLSVSDVSIWHPRFLHWELFHNIQGKSTSRGSTLGYYYSPLIIIDRLWCHPTRQLFADEMPSEPDAK